MNATGLMTLAEAGAALGVSAEQVRRYIHRGLLPGEKLANAWLVPVSDVWGFQGFLPRRGRPLTQAAAWRDILAGRVDLDDPHRYEKRGAVSRWLATPGMVTDLVDRGDIVVGGVRAARAHGALLDCAPDAAHVYVSAASMTGAAADDSPLDGFIADRLGRVVVRAVDAAAWQLLLAASTPSAAASATATLCAPAAAAALDLAISPHPREQHAAETILKPPL